LRVKVLITASFSASTITQTYNETLKTKKGIISSYHSVSTFRMKQTVPRTKAMSFIGNSRRGLLAGRGPATVTNETWLDAPPGDET